VGSGAYGIVIGCEDQKAETPDKKMVAIKKIERTFEHRFYAKRTLRELKILRNLKHENVLIFSILFRLLIFILSNYLNQERISMICIYSHYTS